jgi:hypothetical protein
MKRFLLGLLLGSVAPAAAQQVELYCQPRILPRCENALKMHFETQGHIPNRCKTT